MARRIIADFYDHNPASYSMAIYRALKRDRLTKEIMDAETGEILFYRDLDGMTYEAEAAHVYETEAILEMVHR